MWAASQSLRPGGCDVGFLMLFLENQLVDFRNHGESSWRIIDKFINL
jgi:hypothetical protein